MVGEAISSLIEGSSEVPEGVEVASRRHKQRVIKITSVLTREFNMEKIAVSWLLNYLIREFDLGYLIREFDLGYLIR